MVFVLRVRTPQGVKRLLFQDDSASWGDLQLQLSDTVGVPVLHQRITNANTGAPYQARTSDTLRALKFSNGDLIAVHDASAPTAAGASTQSQPRGAAAALPTAASIRGGAPAGAVGSAPSKVAAVAGAGAVAAGAAPVRTGGLTAKCQHGPRGKCFHCLPEQSAEAAPTRMPCAHGAGATCPNCSVYVNQKESKDDVAEWLCTHPSTAFCPKCLPPASSEDGAMEQPRKCTCDKRKGQECIYCVEKGPNRQVKFLPYEFYMQEKKAACRFSHQPSQVCGNCAPPEEPTYKGKPDCNRGHKPWPYGVCLNCAPPNAHLRVQKYRHCDSVAFYDVRAVQNFYREWMRTGFERQSAAILVGRYIDEPSTSSNVGAMRAEVYAIYQPPQDRRPNGVKFLKDSNEKSVHLISQLLGMKPVGWVVTTLPREGKKYHGKVFLSASEVRQAARFQNRYKDRLGHSKFVTVVVEHAENVEPLGYQVSDQCVALERDGVLDEAEDPYMLQTRVPAPNELVPTVIYKDKPLDPGKEFLPDELLVTLEVTNPKNAKSFFKLCEFPSGGTDAQAKVFFSAHAKEEYHVKLSDFNLLCYLSNAIGLALTEQVCRALETGTRFPAELKSALDSALRAKQLTV